MSMSYLLVESHEFMSNPVCTGGETIDRSGTYKSFAMNMDDNYL